MVSKIRLSENSMLRTLSLIAYQPEKAREEWVGDWGVAQRKHILSLDITKFRETGRKSAIECIDVFQTLPSDGCVCSALADFATNSFQLSQENNLLVCLSKENNIIISSFYNFSLCCMLLCAYRSWAMLRRDVKGVCKGNWRKSHFR